MKTLISVHSTTSASPIDRPRREQPSAVDLEGLVREQVPDQAREGIERADRTQDRVQDHHRADDHHHHAQVEQERDLQYRPGADLAEHDPGLTRRGRARVAVRPRSARAGASAGAGAGGATVAWSAGSLTGSGPFYAAAGPAATIVGSSRWSEHEPGVHGREHAERHDRDHPRRRPDVVLHQEAPHGQADPAHGHHRERGRRRQPPPHARTRSADRARSRRRSSRHRHRSTRWDYLSGTIHRGSHDPARARPADHPRDPVPARVRLRVRERDPGRGARRRRPLRRPGRARVRRDARRQRPGLDRDRHRRRPHRPASRVRRCCCS